MNRTQTVDDATITLEGVDIEEEFVVIRFNVQDLKDDRRNLGNPAALMPVLGSGPPKRFRRTSGVSPTRPAGGSNWSVPRGELRPRGRPGGETGAEG